MEYKKYGSKYVVRIDKEEEIVNSLEKFIKETKVRLASVTGIGAADKITVGVFNTEEQKYYSTDYEGEYEITALNGNISTMKNQPYIHLHITIADEENKAFGGHLNKAVISGTCEIIVDVLDGELDRGYDKKSGLNIFQFEE